MEYRDSPSGGYGGRRARVLNRLYGAVDRLGGFRALRAVDWQRVERLVMVCKGNICRSPYAEARARLAGFRAISCGFECGPGNLADGAALRNAEARQVDLQRHRTTPLADTRLGPGDLLLVMEPYQARRIARRARDARAQLTLLGLWSGTGPAIPCLHDPYGLDDEAFQRCYSDIDTAVFGLCAQLRRVGRGLSAPRPNALATPQPEE